jgi:hypothetical protein
MRCIQYTTATFTALTWDGLAPDAAVVRLPAVVSCRIHIAVGDRNDRCCALGSAASLVALAPTDPSMPDAIRPLVRDLVPGTAIAATALRELVGGWVAMPGTDVRVTTCADLGDDGVVLISLADAAAFLQAAGGERLLVQTVAVLGGSLADAPDALPEGWQVVADGVPSVPLRPAAAHPHGEGRAA